MDGTRKSQAEVLNEVESPEQLRGHAAAGAVHPFKTDTEPLSKWLCNRVDLEEWLPMVGFGGVGAGGTGGAKALASFQG